MRTRSIGQRQSRYVRNRLLERLVVVAPSTPRLLTRKPGRVRQLLSHTSGFARQQPRGRRSDDYQTLEESVSHIATLPLANRPGTHFRYGGLAMQVAGRMG